MKTTFDLLQEKSLFKDAYKKSKEMDFFMKHRDRLAEIEQLAYLYDADGDDFLLIRANIIIQCLLNKQAIEAAIDELSPLVKKDQITKFRIDLKDRLEHLPYFLSGKDRIYIAFFSRAINIMLLTSSEEFLKFPFNELKKNFSSSIIDAFDTYGAELFNSIFTRLIKVGTNGREVAYFHFDTNTIYIVNDQGRLDVRICLFDRYLTDFSTSNMIERITPVVDAYFANDRDEFLKQLHENGFISSKMLYLISINRKH